MELSCAKGQDNAINLCACGPTSIQMNLVDRTKQEFHEYHSNENPQCCDFANFILFTADDHYSRFKIYFHLSFFLKKNQTLSTNKPETNNSGVARTVQYMYGRYHENFRRLAMGKICTDC